MDDLDVEAMLDKCEEMDDHLSQWEREFIDSLQNTLGVLRDGPTTGQLEKLKQIYEKVKDRG